MSTSIGSLLLELKLDATTFNRDLNAARQQAEALNKSFQKQQLLAPKVDHRELTALNAHLDLKQRHFREVQQQFDRTPLRVRVDTTELVKLTKQLDAIRSGSVNVRVSGSVSGVAGVNKSDYKQLADLIGGAVARSSRGGLGGTLSNAVGGLIKAPIEIAASIGRGALEGIGRDISKDLSQGISTGIKKEMSYVIGDMKVVGEAIGEGLSQSIINVLSDELPIVEKTLQDLLGKRELVTAGAAVRGDIYQQKQKRNAIAQQQAAREFDYVSGNLPNIRKTANSLGKKRETLTAEFEKANKEIGDYADKLGRQALKQRLDETTDEMAQVSAQASNIAASGGSSDQVQALTARVQQLAKSREMLQFSIERVERDAVAQFQPTIDKLNALNDKLLEQERTFGKIASAAENVDLILPVNKSKARIPDKVQPIKTRQKKTKYDNAVDFYDEVLADVIKQSGIDNFDPSMKPRLKVNQDLPSGAYGRYLSDKNQFEVRPDIVKQINEGNITEEAVKAFIHELRHAVQLAFGKIDVTKTATAAIPLIKPNAQEARALGKNIEFSAQYGGASIDPKLKQDLEADAYTFTERNYGNLFQKLTQSQKQLKFDNKLGVGGGKAENKLIAAQRQVVDYLTKTTDAVSVPLDDEISKASDRVSAVMSRFSAQLDGTDLDLIPADEIDSVISAIEQSLDDSMKELVQIAREFKVSADAKRAQVKALLTDNLGTLSFKKELVPLSKQYGVSDPAKMKRADVISQMVDSSNLGDLQDSVFEITRSKAQRRVARQESLQNIGYRAGSAMQSATAAIGPIAAPILNAGGSAAKELAAVAQASYSLAKGIENIALTIAPGGKTAKALMQQTVVPAAMFGAATHFIPGGGEVAGMLGNAATHAISPMTHSLGAGAIEGVGGFTAQLPNMLGIQGAVNAALSGTVEAITSAATQTLGQAGAAIGGGKLLQLGMGQLGNRVAETVPALLPAPPNRKILNSATQVQASAQIKAIEAITAKIEAVDPTAAIERAKQITSGFWNAYSSFNAAIEKGDLKSAAALIESIEANADRAKGEIGRLTEELGEVAQFGTPAGSQLANQKSQVSRATNNAKRKFNKMKSASPDIDSGLLAIEDIYEAIAEIEANVSEELYGFGDIKNALNGVLSRNKNKAGAQSSGQQFNAVEVEAELQALKKTLPTLKSQMGTPGAAASVSTSQAEEAIARIEKSLADLEANYLEPARRAIEVKEAKQSSDIQGKLSRVGDPSETTVERVQRVIAANQPLKTFVDLLEQGKSKLGAWGGLLQSVGLGFLGFTVLTQVSQMLTQFAKASLEAAIALQRMSVQFDGALGAGGADAFQAVTDRAVALKTDLTSTRQAYLDFASAVKDTPMEGISEQASQALSQAVLTRGLTADQMQRAQVAITQMASKGGAVQSEEVRGQLAEALPGSTAIFARGMGMSLPEFSSQLQQGNIQSQDALPKFLAQLEAETSAGMADAGQTAAAKMTDLSNQTQLLQEEFGKLILPLASLGLDVTIGIVKSVNSSLTDLTETVGLVGEGLGSLKDLLNFLPEDLGKGLPQAMGGTFKASIGLGLTDGLTSGFKGFMDSQLEPRRANQKTIADNQVIQKSDQAIVDIQSMMGGSDLAKLAELNQKLRDIQTQRNLSDPTDTSGRNSLNEAERQLTGERAGLDARIRKISVANTSAIESLKRLRDEAEKVGDTQGALKYSQQIDTATAAQEKLNDAINTSTTSVARLEAAFNAIKGVLQENNQQIESASANLRTGIANNQSLTVGQREFSGIAAGQVELQAKIQANKTALAELIQQLNDVETQRVLNIAGYTNESSPAKIRETAANTTDEGTKNRLELAANQIEQIRALNTESTQLNQQIAESAQQSRQRITDLTRQITDFNRQMTRGAEDIMATIESAKLEEEFTRTRTKLDAALGKFKNTLFDDMINGVSQLADIINQMAQVPVQAAEQARAIQNQVVDVNQQGADLMRQMPTGGELGINGSFGPGGSSGGTGPTVPFQGVQVTSAVDASGEPGLDYVVSNGQRGAQFGSLTEGQVIETVTDQNWESNLEAGGTRSGYGNRVIVRTVDKITGEAVDILYAHLDRVLVKEGQQIGVGSVLGTQGRTGSTTGAHVSADFFGKDSNQTTSAAIGMRDRMAQMLANNPSALNQQIRQSGPVQPPTVARSMTGATQLSPAEMARLATLSTLEASTPMGRADVAQSVFNRLNSGNYGSSVTDVLYAQGQYQPFFGSNPSQITDMQSAAQFLSKERGMSLEAAMNTLTETIRIFADPSKMADAAAHVGGRTDFKGTSQYGNMVAGEDRLRSNGENFFHIGGNQTYAQLARYQAQAPRAIVDGGAGSMAQAGGSGGAGFNASANIPGIDTGMIDNATARYGNAAILQQRQINSSAAAKLDEYNQQVLTFFNIQGQQMTQAAREIDTNVIEAQRRARDAELDSKEQTPSVALQRDLNSINDRIEDLNRSTGIADLTKSIEGGEATLVQAQEQVNRLSGEARAEGEKYLTLMREQVALAKRAKEATSESIKAEIEALEKKGKKMEEDFKRAQEMRKAEAQARKTQLEGQLDQSRIQSLRRRPLDPVGMQGAALLEYSSGASALQSQYDSEKRKVEEDIRTTDPEEVETLKILQDQLALLERINNASMDNLKNNLTDANNQIAQSQRQIQQDIFSGRQSVLTERSSGLRALGFETQARELDAQAGRGQIQNDLSNQLYGVDQQVLQGLPLDKANEMKSIFNDLANVKMDNLNNQFSVMGQLLPGIQSATAGLFSGILSGTQTAEEAFKGFLGNLAEMFANMAAQMITNQIIGLIMGIGSAAAGGVGGGSLLGGSFTSADPSMFNVAGASFTQLPAFAEGGMVGKDGRKFGSLNDALKREGPGGRVIVAHKDELILPPAATRQFYAMGLDRVLNFKSGGMVGGKAPSVRAGMGGGGANANVTVNVENKGRDMDKDSANKLGKDLENAVIQTMMKQGREGGFLYTYVKG
jgi:tape measure domain-containing protein